MDRRELGRSGIAIAPIMFGGNVFGWTVDQATAFALLDAFLDAGFNAIDTANIYSRWIPGNIGGESETVIGAWMKARGNRSRVVIATKVGHDMGAGRKGLAKTYIKEAVEESLVRLGTNYIDLYQAHKDDTATPQEETMEAFGELIAAGKVRAIGASNFSAARLRSALDASARRGLPRYETLQPRYNLYDRADFEGGLQQLCVAEGVGVIPYYGLASGFLTGKYRSEADFAKSPRGARMKNYLNARGRRILGALDEVSSAYATSPAAVALAWTMAQPGIAAPIASATNVEQLRDFSVAVRLELGAYARAKLDEASKPDA